MKTFLDKLLGETVDETCDGIKRMEIFLETRFPFYNVSDSIVQVSFLQKLCFPPFQWNKRVLF